MTNTSVSPSVAPKTSVDEIPWNKHMSQQRSISDWIVDIIIWVLIVAIVAVVIYPIWFIVVASFSDQTQVSAGNVTVWPKGFTVAGYIRVFQDSRIWTGYTNTILYTVFGTALNLIVTLPAAFGLSRVEFKPRRVILFLFTFTMYFAGGPGAELPAVQGPRPARQSACVHSAGRGERMESDHRTLVLRNLHP